MDEVIELRNVRLRYKSREISRVRKAGYKRVGKMEKDFEALRGVSFDVYNGEILGIIGLNGSGKSTLLRVMAGLMRPDGGKVNTGGRKITLLALGKGYLKELSGLENIYLLGLQYGYRKDEIDKLREEIIEFSDLGEFIYRPIRTYSSGMRSRLSFAICTHFTSEIILIDELFSVGDHRFREKSRAKMEELIQDQKHTVVMVSHNLTLLQKMCDRILWLEAGRVRQIGAPDEVVNAYINEQGGTASVKAAVKCPEPLRAARTGTGILFQWKTVPEATGYIILRTEPGNKTFSKIGTVHGGNIDCFTDRSAKPDIPYRYTVQAYRAKDGFTEKSRYIRPGVAIGSAEMFEGNEVRERGENFE